MPKDGKKHKQYESFSKKHLPLPSQHTNATEIPGSVIYSAQIRLQQSKHKPGTAQTNTHITPMEKCAFCACKHRQWVNKRTFAFLPIKQCQQPPHACNSDNTPNKTDDTPFITVPNPRRRHSTNQNSSKNDNDHNSNAGIYHQNYYACLLYSDTDIKSNEYDHIQTNNEYKNEGKQSNNGRTTNTGTHTPSQPSSLHVISTLTSAPPSPVPNKNDQYHGNIKHNGNFNNDNGNQHLSLPPRIIRLSNMMTSLFSSIINTKNEDNYDNLQHRDNAKINNNGNKHHSRSQHTPTECNQHEIPSVRQHNDTPTHYLQPILPWTQQHLTSYLALAEVACPWNVEPG